MKRSTLITALACAAVTALAPQAAIAAPKASPTAAKPAAAKKKKKALIVCRRGCPYSSLQKAVNDAPKNATITVKPGKYVEGVDVKGHAKDGLKIVGSGTKPEQVVLEGKGAKRLDGNPAQNGIFVDGADRV